jgi:hypothetical protein
LLLSPMLLRCLLLLLDQILLRPRRARARFHRQGFGVTNGAGSGAMVPWVASLGRCSAAPARASAAARATAETPLWAVASANTARCSATRPSSDAARPAHTSRRCSGVRRAACAAARWALCT